MVGRSIRLVLGRTISAALRAACLLLLLAGCQPPATQPLRIAVLPILDTLPLYVAEAEGRILGTYYIKTNHAGGGAHVCNCGYVVTPAARGQGIARAMCAHSQEEAAKLGYLAMQYNLVVETNTGAIALWEKMGFETVGRLPRAFEHPQDGLVDARVMYKWLPSGQGG